MINAIPFIGWIISAVVSISMAIPFYFFWSSYGIGSRYFDFLPAKYQLIPFWDCVGLFVVMSILKSVLPKLVSVSNNSESKSSK
jgi:hypothetical protein